MRVIKNGDRVKEVLQNLLSGLKGQVTKEEGEVIANIMEKKETFAVVTTLIGHMMAIDEELFMAIMSQVAEIREVAFEIHTIPLEKIDETKH